MVTLTKVEEDAMIFMFYVMEKFEAQWKERLLKTSFNGKTIEIDPEVMIPVGTFYRVFKDCEEDLKNAGYKLKAVKTKK